MKDEKIYYQGSKGSYSESVLLEMFPESELLSCKTFQEVSVIPQMMVMDFCQLKTHLLVRLLKPMKA